MVRPDRKTAACQAVVIWIDWYAYHIARFEGLQMAFGTDGEVRGIELVGGAGVHKGYEFREGRSEDLPIQTLRPAQSWSQAGKVGLSLTLLSTLSRLDAKVVLVPGYYTLPALAAALWCKANGRVSVLMTETTAFDHVRIGWRETLKSRLIRTLFDWAVTGGSAHDRYLLHLGFPSNHIAHFYDVVGNSQIYDGVTALRTGSQAASYALPSSYFLYVGRLAPEKNVSTLLLSWLSYRAAGGVWSLVLAGDGPERDALREQAQASQYASDVHLLGHRSARELLPAYAFAKAFVLPSIREPWGLVANEAMAARLPVIISDRCGCACDLVAHGENGFIFNPAHPTELTEYMQELSSNSEAELERKGHCSLRRIAKYTPESFGHQIAAIAKAGKQPASARTDGYDVSTRQGIASESCETKSTGQWLHVLSHIDPKYGGLSSVVPRLAEQLSSQEEIPTGIAAFCGPDETNPGLQREGALSRWPLQRLDWMLQPRLRARFRSRVSSSQGLHIHGMWEISTFMAAAEARRARVPYVLSAHGMLESWALDNKRLKKLIYSTLVEHRNTNGAACLHALTRAEAEDYRKFGCSGPIAVIPNGVDAPPSATPREFLNRYPESVDRQIVLFLGRVHFKKGIKLLIQAWAATAERFPEALLVVAGPDSENTLAEAEQLVTSLNLRSKVLFTGMLDAPMKWSALAAADFFVLPSYSEGLAVAALEAMSMGVPLILSEQCNLPEVSQEGAGWLVETEVKELTRVLATALGVDPASRQHMSRCARALARRDFGWETVTGRMAQVYRWVCGGQTPPDVEILWGQHAG